MDDRARKISATMRRKKLDNFKIWRDRMKIEGKIKSRYVPFKRSEDLAELIGIILGDGNITSFPRCDCLRITGDSQKPDFIYHSEQLIQKVFNKSPRIAFAKTSNAMTVTIYEKHISSRLGIPSGSRQEHQFILPKWIQENPAYVICFLRGLYQAEGTLAFHVPTYTHKFIFTNYNQH